MSEPSPRPWHFNRMRPTIYSDEKLPDGSARVVLDIETDHLPLLPCDPNDRQLIADLALIVDAVNERDRLAADEARYRAHNVVLRDIVRRFVDLFTPETIHPAGTMERLLREARAAIGEEDRK